jgi:ParB-like nuclease domain
VSDRNHFVASDSSDSFTPFTDTETPADSGRAIREGLPPAFRMRADAHYVEHLDGATPAVTVQYVAAHVIDVSDAPTEVLPGLVESIKRYGVLEPLVVQRNNGAYKTIAGQKRLAAAQAAGLLDVPCIVHHVSDERAQALREVLQPPRTPIPVVAPAREARREAAVPGAPASVLDVAVAAMRLIGSASEGTVSVVKTATGARLSIDLPFGSDPHC